MLVGDEPALFDVALGFAHRGEKCNFISGVAIIDVVRKAVDRLKNLIFNTHNRILMEPKAIRNGTKQKFVSARAPSTAREARALPRDLRLTLRKRSRAGSGRYSKRWRPSAKLEVGSKKEEGGNTDS